MKYCPHCGHSLTELPTQGELKETIPWWFQSSFLIIMFLAVGPLVLPLIWFRPKTSLRWKIGLTVGIVIFTVLLVFVMVAAFRILKDYYDML